jgi:hypothetical protein
MDDGGDVMRISVFVLLATLSSPVVALADGMTFTVIGADMDVRATEQRAVMWLRDWTWEIHIQPVFPRDAGGAAWVVPFPVQPTVEPGNADFFDQLELITSPVFAKVCSDSDDGLFCFGCFGSDGRTGGLGDGDASGTLRVIVWEQGKVGDLDYVILSAFGGDNLVEWLNVQGYQLPTGAQTVISEYETEGVYFFVARLAADVNPEKPLAPVRFILPGLRPPTYPLRLTALGVPAGQELDLTLWVVFPNEQAFLPESHPMRGLEGVPRDTEEFDEEFDKVIASNPAGALVLLFGGILTWGDVLHGQFCWDYPCISFEDLEIDIPTWSEEILEINQKEYWLYRFQTRLSANSMAEDLTFEPVESAFQAWASNIYVEYTCKKVAAMAWLLVLGVGLGVLRRMRRS